MGRWRGSKYLYEINGVHFEEPSSAPITRRKLRAEIHAAKRRRSTKPISKGKRNLARRLRRNQTKWELLAGKFLTDASIKFMPQHVIRGYVVDFAIPSRKLIVEIDGKHHLEYAKVLYDRARTVHLGKAGWRVVRFMNSEIRDDADARQRFLDRVGR